MLLSLIIVLLSLVKNCCSFDDGRPWLEIEIIPYLHFVNQEQAEDYYNALFLYERGCGCKRKEVDNERLLFVCISFKVEGHFTGYGASGIFWINGGCCLINNK